MFFFVKVLIAGVIISFASWLSGQYPKLSGFIIALPIASLIAIIGFLIMNIKMLKKTVKNTFTKSILIAVPVSYLFFLPFFFCKKPLGMNFWIIYLAGISLLVIGYFIHKYLVNFF